MAQKALALCRMRIQQQQAQAGSPSFIASEALSCERPPHHLAMNCRIGSAPGLVKRRSSTIALVLAPEP